MKKRLIIWTFGLMIVTMALQISLMRAATASEKFHEVLIAKAEVYPNEVLTADSFSLVKIAESSMEPWMIKASELVLPAWSSRLIRQGELLTREGISLEPVQDYAEVALKLEPQDAVAYHLFIGEEIDLLGIRGEESVIHFNTMRISGILGQDLKPSDMTMTQPVFLILRGEKKEILELCRIKSTHTFQIIKKKPPGQKEG
ncbi:SAF domain-containing protein [Acidaminobacter sp.]|uniref:SAF domain-containing protein n=1 Tax=Acidaminobacter sp. TaxID=1872102 RepID=UPI00256CF5CF|nr:SAF domain-containing protein [Acidaminobacter sp.]MDK9710230.1 SAF domain-containing protein [Acidaminobacter sp.]